MCIIFFGEMRMKDEYYMNIAIKEAQKAFKKDEIPVGVVIVKNDEIIAKGYNKRNKSNKVKDHAEILAIDKANRRLRNWRLEDCEIYITLEPCPMCASAIEQSRIKRIITGAVNNNNETNNISSEILKNREWTKGIQKDLCKKMLNEFFKNKR